MALTADERRSRLTFDWEVCKEIWGQVVQGEAYSSTPDLEVRRNPIRSITDAPQAVKYRVDFHVRTLIGPGKFAPVTTIGFDLSSRDYPYAEPATWLISDHVPYSPHFKKNYPVCIGDMWWARKGSILLAELLIHIIRLLNWDEQVRPEYAGWNGAAIEYHRKHYGTRPLNPDLPRVSLPAHLVFGVASPGLFVPRGSDAADGAFLTPAANAGEDLFR